jgi:acyl carrier protein
LDDGIEGRLNDLIAESLLLTGGDPLERPFESSDMLLQILDSLVLTTLLALIESEWEIEFSDEEIDDTLLITLGTLTKAVEAKLAER